MALVLPQNLRKPAIEFPSDFDLKEKAAEAELIRRLMDHNPKNRPSALDLLNNKNMPPKMEGAHVLVPLGDIHFGCHRCILC